MKKCEIIREFEKFLKLHQYMAKIQSKARRTYGESLEGLGGETWHRKNAKLFRETIKILTRKK